jgi:receptor protein-tyrosine kinase
MSSIEKAIHRLNQTKSMSQKGHDEEAADKPTQIEKLVERLSDKHGKIQERNQSECLDFSSLSNSQYLVPGCTNKILSEEYRSIKRPIIMNALGKGAAPIKRGNLIGITSSLPGEGKTYTALNLAMSMATELNSTILLIDGDILRFSLSNLLGIENNLGLTDLLIDPTTQVRDVLIQTRLPKLNVIPAGTRSDNSTELLASDAMERLVKELGQRYTDRIILFDTPPLLATNESRVLMHLMGQVLMVVEAGKTSLQALKDSLSFISDNKVVGMVLNKTNNRFGRGGYGGYGGYAGGYHY